MYYLLGKSLNHSMSKVIHKMISDIEYDYLELDEISLLGRDFLGLNVTIPYKEEIMSHLDFIDEFAKEIGAVNTVVNDNGVLKGFNTDYYGFKKLIEKNDIIFKDKRILIIGTGGSSKTVTRFAKDMESRSIDYCSRSKGILITDLEDIYDIIVNTTPVGMYPDDSLILDLSNFSIEVAIDLVYNPLRTRFLLSANTKAVNGLYMLVAQAVKAQEIFFNVSYEHKINEVYLRLLKKITNIVLIGMPMSGKTTLAKVLSLKYHKEHIDTDNLIEEIGSIEKLISDLPNFREIESKVVNDIKFYSGKVISTGGGVILNEKNINSLKLNGVVIYLKRSLEFLQCQSKNGRPLLREDGSLEKMFAEREVLYSTAADVIVENVEGIYEYFNSKWC